MWLRRDWGCRSLPAPVTDWPQAPAGLLFAGLRLDRAGHRLASSAGRAVVWGCASAGPRLPLPALTPRVTDGLKRRPGCWLPGSVSTVPVTDWPQTPAGLWGSRVVRRVGRAGPGRGTSSQTAWCGVSRFKAAVCAVCCGGTPTRPRPSVSSASSRRWGRTRPSPTDLCGERKHSRWLLWRGPVSVTASSALRRLAAYETVGWGRVGVPPQQTAHTAVLLQLTPHHAVCEEVPRRGPAPPTCRRNREPHSPAGV